MVRTLIGVMGPGEKATAAERATAFAVGQRIAQHGWILLTGGRAAGVMEAASQGAHAGGGLVVGILPHDSLAMMSTAVDIPIVTGVGYARNVINVLSSQVVIACGLGAGTLSEIALAIKLRKPLVLMHIPPALQSELRQLATASLDIAETPDAAIAQVQKALML
ncbi:MAG: TIGR00725 family protein [Leptolyngbya sp. SIO1E4]|nr:TIGR00725 family protein [Leptolyngbya sp. SIO1E4]